MGNLNRASAVRGPVLALHLRLRRSAGCKPVGPDYKRPAYTAPPAYKETGAPTVVPPPNPQGGSWNPANPSDGMLRGKWWEVYSDPQLNQLEERIASSNQALHQAMENYLAARDQVAAVRSTLYPTLSANAGFTHTNRRATDPWRPRSKTSYNDLILGGQAAWEPDFWGRIRRSVEASRASAQAIAAEMANVNLSLQAELAADYFQLRGLDSQIKLLKATVADLEHQLDLTQRRLKGGVATDVDVAQAQTQLETVRAQLVDISVGRAQFEHAVGTIANYSLPEFSIPFSPLDLPLPNVPIGVPSQLLERRPDIASRNARPPPPTPASASLSPPITPPFVSVAPAESRARTSELVSGTQRVVVSRRAGRPIAVRRRPAPRPHRPGPPAV